MHWRVVRWQPRDTALTQITVGKRNALIAKVCHHLARRTEFRELAEDEIDGLANGFVRSHDDPALAVVLIADRKMRAQLAPTSRLPEPTIESRADEMKLDLAHGPLQPE